MDGKANERQEKLATIDCSYIIASLAKLKNNEIVAFKNERKSDNLMLLVAEKLLYKRKQVSNYNPSISKKEKILCAQAVK